MAKEEIITLRTIRNLYPNAYIETFDHEGCTVYVNSMSWQVERYEAKEIDGRTYVYAYLKDL